MERNYSTGEVVLLLSGFVFLAFIWATIFWTMVGYVDRESDRRIAAIDTVDEQITALELRLGIIEERQRSICQRLRQLHGLPRGFCSTL